MAANLTDKFWTMEDVVALNRRQSGAAEETRSVQETGAAMTKRGRRTGMGLKGRSYGRHPKDGPVKHIHIGRRRAKKARIEVANETAAEALATHNNSN
jgi:hypothetical protein